MIGIEWSTRQSIHLPHEEEAHLLDLTPLLDVIFILLIFFILTSGITQIVTPLKLPRSDQFIPTEESPTKRVHIEIFNQQKIWKINETQIKEFSLVKTHLLEMRQKHRDLTFVIAPERSLPVEELIQLLNFFSAHQITDVQIISEWIR